MTPSVPPGPSIAREKKTIAAMVRIYCAAHRHDAADNCTCAACQELLAYSRQRLDRCPYGDAKPSCKECPIHCYLPARREQMREVMREAGPRMLWRHPRLAVVHLWKDHFRKAPPRRRAGSETGPARIGVAYAAAAWALVFAVFHVMWAFGLHIGLDENLARVAFSQRWFLAYDLVVVGVCAFAVPVALALARPTERRLPAALLAVAAWGGSVLLVVRAGGSVAQAAYLLAAGRFRVKAMDAWELWFCLGAVLFTLSTLRYWRARQQSGSPFDPNLAPWVRAGDP